MAPNDAGGLPATDAASPDARSLLAAVVDSSHDAVVTLDRSGIVLSWNLAAERIFGHRAEEIVGTASEALVQEHLRHEFGHAVAQARAGDLVDQLELEGQRRNGMPVPVAITVRPVDGGDTGVACVIVARDITEQRLAQAALGEMETRLRAAERMAGVGSWLWDLGTGVVQWTDEMFRIHGLDPTDFAGTFEAHLAPIRDDDRERVGLAMEEAVASQRPFDAEYRVVRPDGRERRIHARAEPTFGSAGTVVGLHGIGRDITP